MPPRRGPYRRTLARVDLATDNAGLPASLIDAIEADGGLWFAGDWYTEPADIVDQATAAGARALRLDCRDLTFLADLPGVRYVHLRTDGRPPLEPIAALPDLRALILEVGSLRGTLDISALPALRWLKVSLGGKGGEAMAPVIAAGHPRVEWLAVAEARTAVATDVMAPFPALRAFTIRDTDRLRRIGPLGDHAPALRTLSVDVVGLRSLDGIQGAPGLEMLGVSSSPIVDIEPIRSLRRLRGLRLWTPRLTTIDALRGLPDLRFLDLLVDGEADTSVLDSLPSLAALGRRRDDGTTLPWPDLHRLDRADPLRREWERLQGG